jgi:photosystem II stability/assembly factor-like uncharacterized protein
LRALSPLDARTAWVAGADGAVLHTGDGGESWQHAGPPGGTDLRFRSVVALDARTVVLLSFGADPPARVLRTDDAGAHWQEVFRDDGDRFFDCLALGGDGSGLALADPVLGRFALLATADSGRSWTELEPDEMPPALAGETAFAASGTCLVGSGGRYWFTTGGGDRARVFRTADAGLRWEVADTPVPAAKDAGLFALAFRDAHHAVAVGGDYHDQSTPTRALASTSDGGRTWVAPGATLPGYRSGITWTGREYVAVGPNGADVSRDDGATWTPIDTEGFDVVHATAAGTCWAAGSDGRVIRLAVSPPRRPPAAAPRPGPASAPR